MTSIQNSNKSESQHSNCEHAGSENEDTNNNNDAADHVWQDGVGGHGDSDYESEGSHKGSYRQEEEFGEGDNVDADEEEVMLYTNEDSHMENSNGQDNFHCSTHNVTDALPEDDLFYEDDSSLESDINGELPVATTNTGRSPMVFDFPSAMAGLHVLFNKHQNLLVRFDRRLEASWVEKKFLETIVSRGGQTLPLLYPEGLIFPSIFWLSLPDNSIAGAMPGSLLSDDLYLKSLGIATLHDHFRSRILNTSLLTSTDHRYQFFAMDGCINLGMRGSDTRVILSRGFSECHTFKEGIRFVGRGEHNYVDSDSIDTRPVVNRLAAAMGVEMPTFFYTHTCSMKTHLRMRVMKQWLDSEEAVDMCFLSFKPRTSTSNRHEHELVRNNLASSASSIIVRSWLIIMKLWMLYITKSPEKPIGGIKKHWYRLELQETEANVPHVHAILWHVLDRNNHADEEQLLSMIRASISGMVTDEEYEDYRSEGIVTSRNVLHNILEQLAKFLEHKHNRRCMVRKRKAEWTDFTIAQSHDSPEPSSPIEYKVRFRTIVS